MKTLSLILTLFLFTSCATTQQRSTTPVRPSRMPTFETLDRGQSRQQVKQTPKQEPEKRQEIEIRKGNTADTVIAVLPTARQTAPRPQEQRPPAITPRPEEITTTTAAAARTLEIPTLAGNYQSPNLRILLHRNIQSRKIRIRGQAEISAQNTSARVSDSEIEISFIDNNTIQISAQGRRTRATLPCTISFIGGQRRFADGANEYRGQMIIIGGQNGFSVINYIGLEDYLRGVLPLEIGVRGEKEFEALKAQAIAARTFALSRMLAS